MRKNVNLEELNGMFTASSSPLHTVELSFLWFLHAMSFSKGCRYVATTGLHGQQRDHIK